MDPILFVSAFCMPVGSGSQITLPSTLGATSYSGSFVHATIKVKRCTFHESRKSLHFKVLSFNIQRSTFNTVQLIVSYLHKDDS